MKRQQIFPIMILKCLKPYIKPRFSKHIITLIVLQKLFMFLSKCSPNKRPFLLRVVIQEYLTYHVGVKFFNFSRNAGNCIFALASNFWFHFVHSHLVIMCALRTSA